ncbi:MAG TPA: hypothetical protein VKN99_19275 [Polyangia bacterium]|nr:hypothetical protein [Polyangia bacterium]
MNGRREQEAFEVLRRTLHAARSSVVAMGAVLRLLRERTLQLPGPERERSQHEIDLLLRSVDRIDALITRARPLVPGRQPRRRKMELLPVLERARQAAGSPAATLEVPPLLPGLLCDAETLTALLADLIERAGHAGGPVAVRAQVAQRSVRIDVVGAASPAAVRERALARALAARLGVQLRLRSGRDGKMVESVLLLRRP